MSRIKKVFKFVGKPFIWFKRTRRRNKVFTIIILGIAAIVISNIIQQATAKSPYEVQKAKYEDVVQFVSETGNINTSGRVDIYSTTTGIIEELYVENGSTVKTGQELFSVRSTATDQEKAAAYATYQSAVSAQKTAERAKLTADASMWTAQKTLLDAKEVKRVKDTSEHGYDELDKQSIDAANAQAEKSFTAAETNYKESDIAVTAAKAQVTSSLLGYQATKNAKVKATTNGTVANLSLTEGDNVTSGGPSALSVGGASAAVAGLSAGTTSTPVLTIANLTSQYSIKLPLNEVDIPKVNQGQVVKITLDAFSGKTYNGIVTNVDAVGTNTQGVITYNVLVSIDNPDSKMKPGMTADADIEVDRQNHVLTVPNSAVKPYKGGRAVRIVDPKTKTLKFVPVEIGIKGETRTQITKGITEGQEVVTALTNEQVQKQGLF
jgi:HlyD family secretion protein